MNKEKPIASFITFYSFKGGVGRSMALINTAGILAGRGFRVLVIDLDLEAPGLSYLNPDAPDASMPGEERKRSLQLGFVDLLSDAKERGAKADLFALSVNDLAKRYTQPYQLPEELREFKDGLLNIMPAGKFDGNYAQRFDSLNLRELYQQGLGEPLIRSFKKKIAEADFYDYVLVDSRTGFSDEAGICTRDLADHLMILSGLNRQNVEGTSEFLKALRIATGGRSKFQIILSPVPNGEDALLDAREKTAKEAFENAWGAEIPYFLQIPYHPQLALTEEPHIFRRRRGYLFEAYRDIERSMLKSLGHDTGTLMKRVDELLDRRDYVAVLRNLHHIIRLDRGRIALSRLANDIGSSDRFYLKRKADVEPAHEKATFDDIVRDKEGRHVIEFIVDHLPLDERGWGVKSLLAGLTEKSPDLADRLFKRMVNAAPLDADTLGNYAVFLKQRGDKQGAEAYYKRAIEADPTISRNLGNYAVFLEQGGDNKGAASYYKQAIEADPKSARQLGNYADFLEKRLGDMDRAEEYYKRAIEAGPKDAWNLRTFAAFLDKKRGNQKDAEIYYKRAIKADPKNDDLLTKYALFLQKRGDLNGAEEYYKRAVEYNPKNALALTNYGQLLVGFGRLSDATAVLQSALKQLDQREPGNTAEVCLSLWLVLQMQKQDAQPWERRFKFIVQQGFKRFPWSFDRMLEQAKRVMQPKEFEYATALASAYLDESKVPQLERYDQWRALEPLDPKAEVVTP